VTERGDYRSSDVVGRLLGVRCWQQHGVRAPHKAFLLLIALARVQRGMAREMRFEEVEPVLEQLLTSFGPPRKSHGPHFPFWHLQSDHVWTLRDPDQLRSKAGHPSRTAMRAHGVGGLAPEIETALKSDSAQLVAVARELLDRNFPVSMHDAILNVVGLDLAPVTPLPDRIRETSRRGRVRDPEFRRLILRIYECRCAFCGQGGTLAGEPVGIEAAHIRWHAADGPNSEDNGVAACALHHAAFDRGAISISPDHVTLVSESFVSSDESDTISALSRRPLRRPLSGHMRPHKTHLDWHHEQVFHTPARV
jgi:putative restriction endonuclease